METITVEETKQPTMQIIDNLLEAFLANLLDNLLDGICKFTKSGLWPIGIDAGDDTKHLLKITPINVKMTS